MFFVWKKMLKTGFCEKITFSDLNFSLRCISTYNHQCVCALADVFLSASKNVPQQTSMCLYIQHWYSKITLSFGKNLLLGCNPKLAIIIYNISWKELCPNGSPQTLVCNSMLAVSVYSLTELLAWLQALKATVCSKKNQFVI